MYTVVHKNPDITSVILSNVNRCSHFLHRLKENSIFKKTHLTLTLVPHYLGKVKRLIYLKNHGMCTL